MLPKLKRKLIMQIVRVMSTLLKKETKYNYEIMKTKKLSTRVCSELLNLRTLKNSQDSKIKNLNCKTI